ncbi:MAG: oxidoreductase [Herminiimonas sp.]|nr:oxidoreductase [Herminiimonas sp.]MDB5852369.1 oxidoreductase [Herminiimonas sp.]
MTSPLKIDFVSDIACPWCIIGLKSLEDALGRLDPETRPEVRFQPFELNPQMPAEGQDVVEHLSQKYGATREQMQHNQETIRVRGEEVGFKFDMDRRNRVYNTFDAHRLLHWAEIEGKQPALKHALFTAYFTEGRNVSDPEVLADVAERAGLNPVRAREIVASDQYADDVRQRERFYLDQGIHSVPAVIVNDQYLIQGGQPAAVFEQALRQILSDEEKAGASA